MMKSIEFVKPIEGQASELLENTLRCIPIVDDISFEREPVIDGQRFDFLAKVRIANRAYRLICEVKPKLLPKQARMAVLNMADIIKDTDDVSTGILMSDYLSPTSRLICSRHGIGYLDFEGNVRLALNEVFVEREVSTKPVAERKKLKSLFKPKSTRVLKKMLANPARRWRITELAAEANVSVGHISNIRRSLLDREFSHATKEGFFLCDPDRLLDTWQAEYTLPAGKRLDYYTTLHGKMLTEILQKEMKNVQGRPDIALASFSAADRLAPYTRYSNTMLYADKQGLMRLEESLNLRNSPSGANVKVVLLEKRDVLDDCITLEGGVICTSPIQTFLDLASHGERGSEAADFLRTKLIKWDNNNE